MGFSAESIKIKIYLHQGGHPRYFLLIYLEENQLTLFINPLMMPFLTFFM